MLLFLIVDAPCIAGLLMHRLLQRRVTIAHTSVERDTRSSRAAPWLRTKEAARLSPGAPPRGTLGSHRETIQDLQDLPSRVIVVVMPSLIATVFEQLGLKTVRHLPASLSKPSRLNRVATTALMTTATTRDNSCVFAKLVSRGLHALMSSWWALRDKYTCSFIICQPRSST